MLFTLAVYLHRVLGSLLRRLCLANLLEALGARGSCTAKRTWFLDSGSVVLCGGQILAPRSFPGSTAPSPALDPWKRALCLEMGFYQLVPPGRLCRSPVGV